MIGRRSFPFEMVPFSGDLFVFFGCVFFDCFCDIYLFIYSINIMIVFLVYYSNINGG